MKNKDQNGVFNLKQLVDNVIPPPEASEVMTPRAAKMWALLTWPESHAKGFSKTTNKEIPSKEHKLEK